MKNKLKAEIFDIKHMLENNIDLAVESFEELSNISGIRAEKIDKLNSEIKKRNEKIDTLNNDKDKLLMEINWYKGTHKELREEIAHLSQLNEKRNTHTKMIEDKLIEATKPWYLKLKDKLTKFGIRNPFYLTDGGS